MITYSVYIVDDDEMLARGIAMTLQKNYRTKAFFSGADALKAIKKEPPDVVLLDVAMPEMDGLEVLNAIKKHFPDIIVIMITGNDDADTVVCAMKAGAYDYIVKSASLPDHLEKLLENAVETIRLRKELQALQEKNLKENLPVFIGKSKKILDIMDFVKQVAKSPDTSVMILGESGTGKELIAGATHYRSPNFKGPFVSLNCAAIPKELTESELFGYEKGAFSGASSQGKKGLLAKAENGTLFLDEIGDLSAEAQAKLLRFLENGEFYRVGGTRKLRVRTRILSASNKTPESMMADGTFREDLYFRISTIRIEIPSLNERAEDIPLIARYFLASFAEKFGKKITGISPYAETALKSFQWKGNIRELKNVMERAALVTSQSEIQLADLGLRPCQLSHGNSPDCLPIPPEGLHLPSVLESVEKAYIRSALEMTQGNETKAAKLLKMNYTTFRYRKKKLMIT